MAIPNSLVGEEDVNKLAEKIEEVFDKQDYGAGTTGYSGKKPAGSGSKTVRGIRQLVIKASADNSRQQLEEKLATDLKHLLLALRHEPERKEYLLDQYLKWLNRCLKEKTMVWYEEGDVECEQFGARGPGGQNINKSEQAVRCVHTPSLIRATNQDRRNLWENKKEALEVLKGRLEIHYERWRQYLHSFHGSVEVTPDLFWAALTKDAPL